MSRKLIFIFIGLALTIPVFLSGFFVAHDVITHLNWSNHFAKQFWAGDFYPRWLVDMNGGRGSPVFFFYGPLPYYLISLLKPLFSADPFGWMVLGFGFSLALIASGVSAYIWLRDIVDKNSAFCAALFYMVLPYHLAVDLYYRFAFAEFWAFVWIPLILFFTRKIVVNEKFAVLKFGLAYFLLIVTHVPSALIFSPIPPIYASVVVWREKNARIPFRVFYGMILGLGLSAFYLIPAIVNQANISSFVMTQGRYYYENGFLFSGQLLQPVVFRGFWNYVSWITVMLAITAILSFVTTKLACDEKNKKENTFWVFVAFASVFMMFSISNSVWQIFPFLQKIQFPWRFNVTLSVATVALFAAGLSSSNLLQNSRRRMIFIVLCALVWGQVIGTGKLAYDKVAEGIEPAAQREIIKGFEVGEGVPEYLPRWVPGGVVADVAEGKLDRVVDKVEVLAGKGHAEVVTWEPGHIELTTQGASGLKLLVSQFYYPGWTARLRGDSTSLPLDPATDGLIGISVPAGEHRVLVDLETGREECLGEIISLIFFIVVLGLILRDRRGLKLLPPGQ